MREGINEMGDDLVVMQKGASDIFGGFIPEQTIERIASIPGVTRASGELFMFAPSADGSSVLAQGWPDTSYLWKKVPLREGRVPAGGEHGVAVLGDAAAAALGKKLGDDIVILGDKFKIIGIANYTTTVNRGVTLLPLSDLQKISHRPEQVTMVHLNGAHGGALVNSSRSRARLKRSETSPRPPPTRCWIKIEILRSWMRYRWPFRSLPSSWVRFMCSTRW